MPVKPTIGEPMKTVAHHQQLNAPPSCFSGLKAVGVINLATKLANDSLDDVGCARHPGMIEMGEEKRELVLKGEALPLQSTVLEGLPSLLPEVKTDYERFRAEMAAKSIPEIQQIINRIKLNP